ncbi:putative Phosphatidylinositol-4-phosphate 5-kinase [Giardia muris]|uniref:Putative Phosphatidylinositol-4-phosphate 5-kinase n=1 Tax=Giardia muris TaxID=5742 RepID=A0A4Z1SWX7_GIAMU|nr:putative Phosphatidylinositol-4-phosphate 5-kinase [Giardia muris]|eukprot:TNJ30226.1 putative Phosphatidylinositol-4-phosphate 5-kinase [Giardia muris]
MPSGRLTLKDGTVYEGELNGRRRTGHGRCTYPNGSVYVGYWANDCRSGAGTLTFSDGTFYQGEWHEDLYEGQGILSLGETHYEGRFVAGQYSGEGYLEGPNFAFTGEFRKGLYHGQGKLVTSDFEYTGSFIDGFESGEGQKSFVDGTVYTGGFRKGKYHGPGKLLLPNLTIYSGQFQEGFLMDPDGCFLQKPKETETSMPNTRDICTRLALCMKPDAIPTFEDYLLNYSESPYMAMWNFMPERLLRAIANLISRQNIVEYNGGIEGTQLHGNCIVQYRNSFFFTGNYISDMPKAGKIQFSYDSAIQILETSNPDTIQFFKLDLTFSDFKDNTFVGRAALNISFRDLDGNAFNYKSTFELDHNTRRQGSVLLTCNVLTFSGLAIDDGLCGAGTLTVTADAPLRATVSYLGKSQRLRLTGLASTGISLADSRVYNSISSSARPGTSSRIVEELPTEKLTLVYDGMFQGGLRHGEGVQKVEGLYSFTGQFCDDQFVEGTMVDYLSADPISGERLARRTTARFNNNQPECPATVTVETFKYTVALDPWPNMPEELYVLPTSEHHDDDVELSIQCLRTSHRYFVQFLSLDTEQPTRNLINNVFDPSNLAGIVPQFYVGELSGLRLIGRGTIAYTLPDPDLLVLVTGPFIDGFLVGDAVVNCTPTNPSDLLQCLCEAHGAYQRSMAHGRTEMRITVQMTDLIVTVVFTGNYTNSRRKGQGHFKFSVNGEMYFTYEGQFEGDLPTKSGSIILPRLGTIRCSLLPPLKSTIFALPTFFSFTRFQALLEELQAKSPLMLIGRIQGQVEIDLIDAFAQEHIYGPLGLFKSEGTKKEEQQQPLQYKGYLSDDFTLEGETVELRSGRFEYTGPMKNNKLCGTGTLRIFDDGQLIELYEGGFVDSMRSGSQCTQTLYHDGEVYVGAFSGNLRAGEGTLDNTTLGYKYAGQFHDGLFSGMGTLDYLVDQETRKYVGGFSEGKFNGIGRLEYSNGSYYDGGFQAGIRQGNGVWYDATTDTLTTGEFQDDVSTGQCEVIQNYSDPIRKIHFATNFVKGVQETSTAVVSGPNYTYQGGLQDGLFHGQGNLVYSNGVRIRGSFSQGKLNGLGTMESMEQGYVLSAFFEDGIPSTRSFGAKVTFESTSSEFSHIQTYLGPVAITNDIDHRLLLGAERIEGKGITSVVLYRNGDIYRGSFHEGKRWGLGKVFLMDLEILIIGSFVNDQLEGEVTILYRDGEIDTGTFIKGQPMGKYTRYISGTANRIYLDAAHGSPQIRALQPIICEQEYREGVVRSMTEILFSNGDIRYIGPYCRGIFYGRGKIYYGQPRMATIVWKLIEPTHSLLELTIAMDHAFWEVLARNHLVIDNTLSSAYVHAVELADAAGGAILRVEKDNNVGQIDYGDGTFYEGMIRDCLKHGTGRQYTKDYTIYEGTFVDDKPHGEGLYYYDSTGQKYYRGSFIRGLREGKGEMCYPNGSSYVGEYLADLRQGHGRMSFKDGSFYEGDWEGNEMSGHGLLHYKSGDVYEGELRAGAKHGVGTFTLTGGDRLSGTFVNDVLEGTRCIINYANGDYFEGAVSAGLPNGSGIKRMHTGDVYVGTFENGKYHGHGEMTFANGDRYVGGFANNQMAGQGVMQYADGTIFEGVW